MSVRKVNQLYNVRWTWSLGIVLVRVIIIIVIIVITVDIITAIFLVVILLVLIVPPSFKLLQPLFRSLPIGFIADQHAPPYHSQMNPFEGLTQFCNGAPNAS